MEDVVSKPIAETIDCLGDQLQDFTITNSQNDAVIQLRDKNLSDDSYVKENIYDKPNQEPEDLRTNAACSDLSEHKNEDVIPKRCSPDYFDTEEENENASNENKSTSIYHERPGTARQKSQDIKETQEETHDIINHFEKLGLNDFRVDEIEENQQLGFQDALTDAEPAKYDTYREPRDKSKQAYNPVERKVNDIIPVINFDVKLFDSTVESVDCDMCFVDGKVVNPTSYCYTCEIYLCGTCYKYHTRISTTCDHRIVHKNDLVKNVYKEEATYTDESKEENRTDKPLKINRQLVDPGRYTADHVREDNTRCAPCNTEGRKEKGSAFCVTCAQYLCRKCKSYHTKFSASSDHEMVHRHSMEDADFKTFVPAYVPTPKSDNKGFTQTFGSTATLKTETPRDKSTNINWKTPKTFSALIYHDVLTPEITGLSYTGDRKLLVCDRRNKCLKLFSEKLLPLSTIDVPDIADVTSLSETTVVVSQPEKMTLLYIGFRENTKMFIKRPVGTKGKYWGVEHLGQELFALCMSDSSSQASIHMLNQAGQVLSIIQPHIGQGYDLQLKNSKYFAISPTGGTFYISDTVLGVVVIGTDGRAIFSVQSPDIERPSGIQADSKNIYVCCPATSSIVTISPDGTCCHDAVSFTENRVLPNSIALGPNTSEVAVAFSEGETISLYKGKY